MTTCEEARNALSSAQDAVWGKRDAASNAREALSNAESRVRTAEAEWNRLTAALVGRDREVEDLERAADAARSARAKTEAHYRLMLEYLNMVNRGEKCPLDGYDDQRPAYRQGEYERANAANEAAGDALAYAEKAVTAMTTARQRTQAEFDRATTEKYAADDALTTARSRSQLASEALTTAENKVTSAERVVNEVC